MRLPWTIWRHVFAEMWRLLLLTTAVLAVVTAFGITVRYTASGKLSPLDTLKFMGLAIVPMLQYVLPFAAGFGATLAYHRMTHDNELTAAKAGGISHRALMVPALVTGLIVAAGLSELNGYVIPRFLRSMEGMIAQDAAQMVVRTIESGQALKIGNRQIYADAVYPLKVDDNDPNGPTDVLMLSRVLAVEYDSDNRVVRDATAGQATLAFFPADASASGGGARVVLEPRNPVVIDKTSRTQVGSFRFSFPIPSRFNDNPRYNTNRELAELPAHPDRLNVIDSQRHVLANRLAEHDVIAGVQTSLKGTGQARLTDSAGQTFAIRASGLRREKDRWELIPPAPERPVEVDLYRAGARPGGAGGGAKGVPDPSDRIHLTCKTAGLSIEPVIDPGATSVTLSLDMEDVLAQAREGEPAGQRKALPYAGLAPRENPLAPLLAKNTYELLAEHARRAPADRDAETDAAARELNIRLTRLLREAVSHQHERAALAGACLVMVLIGALTAMRMGDSLPLTVYLWSFFPALLSVISISAGQTIAYQIGSWGLIVLWAGLAALSAYAFAAFWTVRRH